MLMELVLLLGIFMLATSMYTVMSQILWSYQRIVYKRAMAIFGVTAAIWTILAIKEPEMFTIMIAAALWALELVTFKGYKKLKNYLS